MIQSSIMLLFSSSWMVVPALLSSGDPLPLS